MSAGIGAEFDGIELGDRRLNKRAKRLLETLAADPAASVNSACDGWSETQAAYRLFNNSEVRPEKLLQPHVAATHQRIARQAVVLIVQDTTELDFSTHPTRDAGVLNRENRFGFYDHCHLVFTPERLCLGVLQVDLFSRTPESLGKTDKRAADPIELKESYRWLRGYRLASVVAAQHPQTQIISVADCEGDIYDIFIEAEAQATPAQFVIRARVDRSVPERDPAAGGWAYKKVREQVASSPLLTTREIELPQTAQRTARSARLEVRARTVTVKPPHTRSHLPQVTYNVVLVSEVGAPSDGTEVNWLLLTTLPIATTDEVLKVVDYYTARWPIEVFFRVYKTGCRVEDIQLETNHRLQNCLMFYKVIAWRVLYLTFLGRECPQLPCNCLFADAEWKPVWKIVCRKPIPAKPPSLREFIPLLAQLGGYNRRKNAPPPGPQTIWIGIRRMTDFALAWHAFGPEP